MHIYLQKKLAAESTVLNRWIRGKDVCHLIMYIHVILSVENGTGTEAPRQHRTG